jgi:hypothetical protein
MFIIIPVHRLRERGVIGVFLVDAGLALILLGAVSVIRPLRRIGVRSRKQAALWLAAGLGVLAAGLFLPAPLRRASVRRSLLDDFVPAYQFFEHHEIRVQAPSDRVFDAVRRVTAREIRFFRLLTWLRAPRLRKAPESMLAPSTDDPIVEVALRSGFVLLAEERPREIVFGVVLGERPPGVSSPEAFVALDRPGLSKAAMNFSIEEEGNGWCRLTTETRIFSASGSARRCFGAYWRAIYPGSALIRRMWLQAVRRRAEATAAAGDRPSSGIS